MTKKLICVLLLATMIFSIASVGASAAGSRTVHLSSNRAWSSDVRCTLSKNIFGKVKSGTVRCTMNNWGVNVDVRMRQGTRVIWAQNNAIRSSGSSAFKYRDFSLGNNYSYYDLSFRTSTSCYYAPSVIVNALSNCTVS